MLFFPPYICRYIVPVDNTKFASKFTEKHHFAWQLFVFETDLDVCPISFSSIKSFSVFMEWFLGTTLFSLSERPREQACSNNNGITIVIIP